MRVLNVVVRGFDFGSRVLADMFYSGQLKDKITCTSIGVDRHTASTWASYTFGLPDTT